MKPLILISSLSMIACYSGPGTAIPENKVERQMMGFMEKFDRWDENGDGKLNRQELTPAKQEWNRSPAELIKFYDADLDGTLTLREVQTSYANADEKQLKPKH